mmetsp:Transcript_8163/g.22357  ORF Transcript_8163/g.22357 Transcript_8163/m.22357 type:complete len:657 (+) Transcript_8163:52-2022(+)
MLRMSFTILAHCLAALWCGAAESVEDQGALDALVVDDDVCSSSIGRLAEFAPSSCGLDLRQLRGQTQQTGIGPLDASKGSAEAVANKLATKRLLKGISYGPTPLLSPGVLPKDDFFSDASKSQWGFRGRGDLHIMRSLGANTVRLYGNDPNEDHSDFLDLANKLGLGVIPSISDLPYVQSVQRCGTANKCTCYAQVKDAYRRNLERGLLLPDRSYHPALEYVISLNEPDSKLSQTGFPALSFAGSVVSGIDGILDAEKEVGVVGAKPNITVIVSFANCRSCTQIQQHPAIAQMWVLRDAMHNPSKYGIAPRNNLAEFYRTRFTNSFNAVGTSVDITKWLSSSYEKEFPHTPVFIAEYHSPDDPHKEEDLTGILALAEASPLLLGVNFFEFQSRYDRRGQAGWGMFDPALPLGDDMLGADGFGTETGPGSSSVKDMAFFGKHLRVPCLRPTRDIFTHKSLAQIVAAAYGGPMLDEKQLCTLNPMKELTDSGGFDRIWMAVNATSMSLFIARVVEHMGGNVLRGVPLSFAKDYVSETATFAALVSALQKQPSWAAWSKKPACVVDRDELKDNVISAVKLACDSGKVECNAIPNDCRKSIWDQASWVFGSYYHNMSRQSSTPLEALSHCYFNGAALLASSKTYSAFDIHSACVVPTSTI